jgi:hypothetical protein
MKESFTIKKITVVVDLLLPTEQVLWQILDVVVSLLELLLLHVNQ